MSPRPLRICSCQMSLTSETNLGGGVFHYHCLKALADSGVVCLIPLAFNTRHENHPLWDVRVLPIRRTFKLGALLTNLLYFFHLLWLWFVRKERFDLLRVSDPYYIGVAALCFRRFVRIATVGYIFHIDPSERFRNWLCKRICRRLDGIIVTSRFSQRQVSEAFGMDPEKIFVTYGGVPRFSSTKTRQEAKEKMGLRDKTVLSFVGALSDRKNPDGLLDIFAEVRKKAPETFLVLVGAEVKETGLLARLKEKARRLQIENHVRFAGWVDNPTKADYYRATDIFVFPSKLEGFGLAVVEAMLQGVPAVVSDRGSLPEVVEDGRTGFVRDPERIDEFAEAIAQLALHPPLRDAMAAQARAGVEEKFTWTACAAQTARIHERILEQRAEKRLGVFLNTGDSLAVMDREGQKDRFMQRYLPRWAFLFTEVFVFSYGDDRDVIEPNIRFLPKKGSRRGLTHSALIPFVHARSVRRCSLIRVMQTQGALPAVLARIAFGIPYVTTYGYLYGDSMRLKGRPLYGLWMDLLEKVSLRLARAVIVTTPSLMAHVETMTDKKKIHFIPNGVDTGRFFPAAQKSSGPVIVLYVGRLEPHKNLDLAIKAIAPISQIPVELWVVGDGPMRDKWETLCRAKGLRCKFWGTVAHRDLPGIHRQADIFILPSLFEGHPKALIEAFAGGLACIGARSPGIVDVIENGVNGLLADPTVQSFAAQTVRLVSDRRLRERLGTQAREHALREYDLTKLLDREAALLQSLIEERNR